MKAQIDFTLDGKYYAKGEEVKCNNYEKIVSLNEKGFIYPLSRKDLFKIKEELNKPQKINEVKEEKKYGNIA